VAPSIARHHRGLQAKWIKLARLGFRGSGEPVLDVLVSLARDLEVERNDERRATSGLGAIDQASDKMAIFHHVQLKPKGVSFCTFFQRLRSNKCSS
jgi:hypothetical protein